VSTSEEKSAAEDAAREETKGSEAESDAVDELTQRKERALEAVLSHLTLKEAARAAGVSEPTLWRYMRDETFTRRLREARAASVTYTSGRLQGASAEAVKILQHLMRREDAPLQPRIAAARAVLEFSFRARVVDELQAEVDRLKEVLGETFEEAEAREGRGW
jgi:AcrR family transcriptional regulator